MEEKSEQKQEALKDGKKTWEKQDLVWTKIMENIKNYSKLNCPVYKKGRMCFAGLVPDVPPDF